ncbi:MAG TPA: S8 family serine peptidase [Bdellovibrionota bacterium]|jgi:subtilisin family serine protease|nr:S8 family serine peptidase [Bdellovibrionota bacterium]
MTKANRIIGLFIATSSCVLSLQANAERYMVKMRSNATFKQEVAALKDAIRTGRFQAGSRILGDRVRYVDSLAHSNLLIVDSDDAATVAGLQFNPEVEYVEQERWIKIPNLGLAAKSQFVSVNAAEEMPWGLGAVHAQNAWTKATQGARGAGARVAVIDSGIDRAHIDLADRFERGEDFLSKPKLEEPSLPEQLDGSRLFASFIDDIFVQDPSDTTPYPYFDRMGHGTHVAGTIAASQNGRGVVGVAPEAKILAGRVCGFLGCSTVGIVRAIDWAITQRVDVINMSLGGPFPSRAQLEATERAEAAGITVVAASGNDGSSSIGYPAGFPTVVSVGAVTPALQRASFSQHGTGLTITAPGTEVNSSVPTGTGRTGRVWTSTDGSDSEVAATSFLGSNATSGIVGADLVHAKLGTKEDFMAIKSGALSGKFALIQRGVIPFVEKIENAIAAGAAGVVIYNNDAGLASGALTEDGSDIGIPVLMIEQRVGEALAAKLVVGDAASVRVQVSPTDFASFQGTSMASPHVAGVVALMKAANRALTPEQIRTILKMTADKAAYMNEFEYGSGLSNAERAIEFIESTRQNNWNAPNDESGTPNLASSH